MTPNLVVRQDAFESKEDRAHRVSLQNAWRMALSGGTIAGVTRFSWPADAQATLESIEIPVRIAAIGENGGELAGVDIRFTERVVLPTFAELKGADDSGLLEVRLLARVDNAEHSINVRFEPLGGATPTELLPVIRFLDALHPPNALGFWLEGYENRAPDPVPIPANAPTLPSDLLSLVELVARVQGRLGIEFPMPEDLTDEEIADLVNVDRLLRGEVLRGRWTQGSMTIDRAVLGDMPTELSGEPVAIELVAKMQWSFRGVVAELGDVREVLKSARVSNTDDVRRAFKDPVINEVTVLLEPGPNAEAERQLVSVRRRSPFDAEGEVVQFPVSSYERLRQLRARTEVE